MSPLTQRLSNIWLREPPTPFLTRAKPDQGLERMVVRLRSPLTVSGTVLSPGTYVLQRRESQPGINLIKIFNEDETRLLATFPTH